MNGNLKKVSIIIPVFNEVLTIKEILKRVIKANTLNLKKEIIIIDDGSTDGTRKLLKSIKAPRVKVLIHSQNLGKSAALKTGFSNASGDVIIIQDADLEYNPDEYPLLLQPILDGADVVYGSRFITDRPHRVLYFWHSIGNHLLTFLSNMFTNLNLTDMETCYKVFRISVIKKILPYLESNRFGFEVEFTALIAKINPPLKIYEIGISYFGRTYQEGKKINWQDGVSAMFSIIKFNIFTKID